ncbi:MAG: AI-2E family transporter [Thiohalorhabdus sp.]|uniref:AI-2E family transporter n=1 Tax=Thiohalorhabdus sp. TaxID=3094134 RepID=UPI0039804D1F
MQSSSPFRSLLPGMAPSLLGAVAVVGLLYVGRNVLIPIVIAALLTPLLAPVAGLLERLRLGRIGSALIVAALLSVVVASVAGVVSRQVVVLADSLPDYRANIVQRIEGLQPEGSTVLGRIMEAAQSVREEVGGEEEEPPGAGEGEAGAGEEREPVPVQIHQEPASEVLAVLRTYGGMFIQPVGMAGLAFVYLIFFLIYREDLRERVIRLAGIGRLSLTSRALDDAGRKITHYLRAQAIINVTYGIPVGIGLWFLGVPNAALWAILAILLRFIPFIGPWVGAGLPVLLSFAVFDGWVRPLGVLGLFLVLELFSNNVLEPWLYGASTSLSPVAVLFAVVFWSALWGLVGLVVAIPLTACLVVLGRYVPALRFFPVILGREPPLPPAATFYHRLHDMDEGEARRLLADHSERHGLVTTLDDVVLPALRLVQENHVGGELGAGQVDGMVGVARKSILPLVTGEEPLPEPAVEVPHQAGLVCIPAHDDLDELPAQLLVALLRSKGMPAVHMPADTLAGDLAARLPGGHRAVLCLSTVRPAEDARVRYLCKRLHGRDPVWPILVGAWGQDPDSLQSLREAGAQVVTGSLAEAREWALRKRQELETLEP